jgi:hypothetical protein
LKGVLDTPRSRIITLSLIVMLGFAVVVELLAFFAWLTDPSAALRMYTNPTNLLFAAGQVELAFFNAGYGLAVWLILLLMVSPILLEGSYRWTRRYVCVTSQLAGKPIQLSAATVGVALVAVSVLAGLMAYLPYSFSDFPVGIDAHWYYERLGALGEGVSIPNLLLEEPRAAYLLLLYGIRLATQLPIRETAMAGAIIVSVLCALGSFFLVREMGQGDLASLLAALFASFSPQMLVGTLASIFSNWLAMAEMLFFFTFLLRAAKTSGKSWLAASLAVSLVIMVTHPWTWPILMLILAIYVVLSALRDRSWDPMRCSAGLRILAGSMLMGLVVFSVASGLAVSQGVVNLAYYFGLVENLRLQRPPDLFLRDVQIALFNYSTQGLFSNWLMISLAVVGVFGLGKMGKETRVLLESWILGPSLLILFLGPEIQWRLLFLIPYHILAVLGVTTLMGVLRRLISAPDQSRVRSLIVKAVQVGFVTFLVLLFLNNALRSMVLIAGQVSI